MTYDFIRSQAFEDKNFQPDLQINGQLWLRQLFMQCQLNAAHVMPKLIMMCAMLIAFSPMVLEIIWESYGLFSNGQMPTMTPYFWAYNIVLGLINFMYCGMNILFMNIAIVDASKRNLMMKRMSQVIELGFHKKDFITIRLPVFNLVDPESIVTWIELRKMILETGSRFQIRIQVYSGFFLVLIWYGLDVFIFFTAIKVVNFNWFEYNFWVFIGIITIILNSFLYAMVKPLSEINQ